MSQIPKNRTGREVNKPLPVHAKSVFPKPYLRALDLKADGHNVKIERVAWVQKYNKSKDAWGEVLALFFFSGKNEKKYLALASETIMDQVMEATSVKNPENWKGKIICIYPTEIEAFGKIHEVIRVRAMDASRPAAYEGKVTT